MANEAVTAIAKSSLLSAAYKDLIQPSAKRVGYSLETITKVVASPITLLDWGYERSAEWLKRKVDARLAITPSEFLVEPQARVAYEALHHISLSYDTPELRELYAELLLKAMDSRISSTVHPAYFHIVEQLAPQEALVLIGLHSREDKSVLFSEKVSYDGYTAGDHPSIDKQFAAFCSTTLLSETTQSAIWLTNLCRLGLLTLQSSSEAVFRPEDGDRYGIHAAQVDNFEHRWIDFTEFGRAFVTACAPAAGAVNAGASNGATLLG